DLAAGRFSQCIQSAAMGTLVGSVAVIAAASAPSSGTLCAMAKHAAADALRGNSSQCAHLDMATPEETERYLASIVFGRPWCSGALIRKTRTTAITAPAVSPSTKPGAASKISTPTWAIHRLA